MRLKRVKNARKTFGGEHLLDDTEYYVTILSSMTLSRRFVVIAQPPTKLRDALSVLQHGALPSGRGQGRTAAWPAFLARQARDFAAVRA